MDELTREEILDLRNEICPENGWTLAEIGQFHTLCDMALKSIPPGVHDVDKFYKDEPAIRSRPEILEDQIVLNACRSVMEKVYKEAETNGCRIKVESKIAIGNLLPHLRDRALARNAAQTPEKQGDKSEVEVLTQQLRKEMSKMRGKRALFFQQVVDKLVTLERRLSMTRAAVRDAQKYRWLKDNFHLHFPHATSLGADTLDAAIDSALKGQSVPTVKEE